ncbi:MAG TPA: J domain-containing protein [Methanomicrobia archaeon]|nr:J domain-containing protein [Methanomicrobia archaeon]
MNKESYFALLDLSPDATEDEIRAAYRQKVKEWHPDYGGDDESFVRLREAYAYALDHARSKRVDDEEQTPLIRKIGALIIVLIMFFSIIYFSLLMW